MEILHNQTFIDLALQSTGIAENAFALAFANDKSITDDLTAGESILIPDGLQTNSDILNYYTAKGVKPATEIDKSREPRTENQEGIDFWTIEKDFVIS